jgi:hypothetical protein
MTQENSNAPWRVTYEIVEQDNQFLLIRKPSGIILARGKDRNELFQKWRGLGTDVAYPFGRWS